MIHICYSHDGSHHNLQITGHAGYAPAGSDIVCAGVSALSFALLGYLRQMGTVVEEAACRKGGLTLRCGAGTQADAAFQMALAGYQIIARTYPQYAEVDITPSEKGAVKEYTAYVQNQHHRESL